MLDTNTKKPAFILLVQTCLIIAESTHNEGVKPDDTLDRSMSRMFEVMTLNENDIPDDIKEACKSLINYWYELGAAPRPAWFNPQSDNLPWVKNQV